MNISQLFPTQWLQVWGLASIQGAITMAWVIYGLYLPELLKQVGLPAAMQEIGLPTVIGAIFAIEGAIAVLMEPLMGGLSDRAQNQFGTRLPFVTFGAILASVLFIAIPSVVIFGGASDMTRWIFLGVIITWAIAMTVFRSPAMCLLGKFAFATNLPQAASILTFVGGIAGSLRSLSSKFILSLGAALTFTIGSMVLIGAIAVLRMVVDRQAIAPQPDLNSLESPEVTREKEPKELPPPFLTSTLLGASGVAIGCAARLIFGEVFPRILKVEVPNGNLDILMGSLSIALAVLAITSGFIATRFGNTPVMIVSLGFAAACLGLLSISHGEFAVVAIAIALVACMSAVFNGTIPLALTIMPQRWGGLGIGMYFGGFSGASALFGYLFPKPAQMITFPNAILMAAIALLLAGVAIALTTRLSNLPKQEVLV
ncbi:MFS transporter [Tumidithrix elongata RA019]|uniref:MFS transporter n=1 Tax=Tumidithrix elongata BACA0141 TaxID=2716417 RepID=A0AAW9Q0R9_9CYAN|nr:MFS transporter [Tumidithrix elongata RA019]